MYIIGKEESDAVDRIIKSGNLFRYYEKGASETDKFEKEWAERIGVKYVIAVSNGTAALICGLAGLGIGPGDEVIVPAYTFISTTLAVLAVGAVPIIAEIDETLTIDPKDVKRKISPRTKVIIPVHMNGLPCNMDKVMDIAKKHKLKVLEDACQADGGSYKGKHLGSIGDAGAFSFNYYKIITCGEGGAIVTDNREVYERALIQHDGGCAFFSEKAASLDIPFFAGWNYRFNEILSVILLEQIKRLDGIIVALRIEKRIIFNNLSKVSLFKLNPVNDLNGDCGITVGLLFRTPKKRREFQKRIKEEGVELTSPIDSNRHVYVNWEPILKKQGAYHPGRDAFKLAKKKVEYSKDMCPRTLRILDRTLFIPTKVKRPIEDLRKLIKLIKKIAEKV